MYRLPVINIPVPAAELDLSVGMYKLPKIQGAVVADTKQDVLKSLEIRQEAILKGIERLKLRITSMKYSNRLEKDHKGQSFLDVVIHANYRTPPHSLPLACRWLQDRGCLKVFTSSHVHSTVKQSLPQNIREFLPPSNCQSRTEANIRITLIWKEDGNRDPECFVTMLPNHAIKGEINLLRFLNRYFGLLSVPPEDGEISLAITDEMMDRIYSCIVWGPGPAKIDNGKCSQSFLKEIEKIISKQMFLHSANIKEPGLIDMYACASLKGAFWTNNQTRTIQDYVKTCQNYFEGQPIC